MLGGRRKAAKGLAAQVRNLLERSVAAWISMAPFLAVLRLGIRTRLAQVH